VSRYIVSRYIVVGAGAIGVTPAAELRRAGRDVLASAAITERVHRALSEGTAPGTLDDSDLLATLPQLAATPAEPGTPAAVVPSAAEGAGAR
jgi:ketopantoate reductase